MEFSIKEIQDRVELRFEHHFSSWKCDLIDTYFPVLLAPKERAEK